MNLEPREYLLDNNTLVQLPDDAYGSHLFQHHVHLPAEVLYEAQGHPFIDDLKKHEYPITPAILRKLKEILAGIPSTDTKLLDLYRNQGNGDPIILACALYEKGESESRLIGSEWVVVSGDNAVQKFANQFDIPILSNKEFSQIASTDLQSGGTCPCGNGNH